MSRLLYRHGDGPANCPFLESLVQSGYHRLHAYSLRLGHVPHRRDVGLFPVESRRTGPGERDELGFPGAPALRRATEGHEEEERGRLGASARRVRQSRAPRWLLGIEPVYNPIWVLISALTWSLTARIQASS